jgi:restriction system protein
MQLRLIDGKELTAVMVRYNVGVQVCEETLELKQIEERLRGMKCRSSSWVLPVGRGPRSAESGVKPRSPHGRRPVDLASS